MQHAPHRPFALSVVPFPIIVLGNKFQEIVSAWFSLGMPKTDDYILFIYYVMCRVEGPLNLGLSWYFMFWQFVEATLIFDYIILVERYTYIYTYTVIYV